MKRLLLWMVLLLPVVAGAKEEEAFRRWEFALSGGLNNNYSWEVEPAFTFFVCRYVGITGGVNFTGQFYDEYYSGSAPGNMRWYKTDTFPSGPPVAYTQYKQVGRS